MSAAGRVAIGVCTAHRPEKQRCCLCRWHPKLSPRASRSPSSWPTTSPAPNNEQTVAEFAATCPFPIQYVREPTRGISRARNAVLDACEGRFDWVAMTDDDCRPETS